MQVSAPTKENAEISEDLRAKLKMNVSGENEELKQEDEENEEEFSFNCMNPDGSPISADDIFCNGQIRPIFPIFDQRLLYDCDGDVKNDSKPTLRPPLRKIFIQEQSKPEEEEEEEEKEPVGPFCEWSSCNKTLREASPEPCKKSNSTGFSKLWRFRELVLRSNSDGSDAFVFLNSNCNNNNTGNNHKHNEKSSEKPEKSSAGTKTTTQQRVVKGKGDNNNNNNNNKKKVKAETVSSLYEKHYVRNREMRDGGKRKSYSPYRQDLVGIFTNVNGLSRNVHPL